MKKSISLLLAAALAVSLFGCSGGGTQNTAPPAGTTVPSPVPEVSSAVDELEIGICKEIEPRTMMSESGAFGRMNYNGFCAGTFLVKDAEGQIQPNLMSSWEIGKNGTELLATFATDQGITWHDGEPLTMDDIEFTVDFCKANTAASYLAEVDHVERVSDTQLRFYFSEPKAFYTLNTMAIFQRIFPKHIWENVDDPAKYDGEAAAIGCGPYKLVQVDEDAQTLHYEAVGDTYMGRELAVRKVTVRSYGAQDALVMAVRNGEVDAMYDYSNPIEPTLAVTATGVEGVDNGMSQNLGNYMLLFGFNKQPTDDLTFRKAVYRALDYQLLATSIGGQDGEIPGAGLIPSLSIGFDASLPTTVRDLDESNSLLDEGGYLDVDGDGFREMPDGSKMDVLLSPTYNATRQTMFLRIAEIISANLADVGIRATLDDESVRNSDFNANLRKEGAYEIFLAYSTHGVGMFKTAYMYVIDEGPGVQWGSCHEPEILEAYQDLMKAQDYDQYVSSVQALQKLNSKHVYGVGLCWDKSYFPYRTDKYEGWTDFPGWGVINCETWYDLHTVS